MDCRLLESTLTVGHRIGNVDSLVYRIRNAEIDFYNILMNKRKFIVKIQQIFMFCAVADNGGRKLLSAVYGVVPSERKSSFTFYFVRIMNGING